MLAFIYVPLTTVTSIYGMNVQQINQSGHSVWIVVITAVIALLVTGYSWSLIEGFYKVKAWRGRSKEAVSQGRSKYGLAIRVFMIFGLIKEGHSRWMWKTNAWWQIITNSDSDFSPSDLLRMPPFQGATACDYVSYFASPFDSDPKEAFELRKFEEEDHEATI